MVNKFLHTDYLVLGYREEEYQMQIYRCLLEIFSEDIVFLCIGSDKCIGDSFGPLVGQLISDNIFLKGKVFGNLKAPINALNLDLEMERIKTNYPKSKIIAVDASLGKENEVGNFVLKRGSLLPGSGVGKNIKPIGDYSLIGIVGTLPIEDISQLVNMRLYLVFEMARILAGSIVNAAERKFSYNSVVAIYQ